MFNFAKSAVCGMKLLAVFKISNEYDFLCGNKFDRVFPLNGQILGFKCCCCFLCYLENMGRNLCCISL